jgi:hypothetical protein
MVRLKKTVIFAVLVLIILPAILMIRSCQTAIDAELTYQANNLVLKVVAESVEVNYGRWPVSWDELKNDVPATEMGGWKWPEDCERIKRRVEVKFDTTTSKVLDSGIEHFESVAPKGLSFPPNTNRIRDFLESLEKSSKERDMINGGNRPQNR